MRAIVISDLHIGSGPLDDCDVELERGLIGFLEALTKSPEPIELIINGDFLDFAQASPWSGKDFESRTKDGDLLCFAESQSLEKLNSILAAHASIFDALREFLGPKNHQLVILPGNHDADFFWQMVQDRFCEAVSDRVTFYLDQVYHPTSLPNVWIEHGHQYDPCNKFFLGDRPRWSKNDPPILNDAGGSVENLIEVLSILERSLPKTLIFVIDQSEEVLTLNSNRDEPERDLFFDFVSEVSKESFQLKLVVALRTEYYGEFMNELKKRRYSQERLKDFLLEELNPEQLVEAIKMPTRNNLPEKYLHGRCQPRDFYGFEFEDQLPEKIVADLRKVETKGGLLPILQIVCERLYKTAKASHRGSAQTWKITNEDYVNLGRLDGQVDDYVNERLYSKIHEELPKLSAAAIEDERALWKDLLYELVVVESDNRALTAIRGVGFLRTRAKELGCRVDFDKMIAFLANDEQRILRRDEQVIERQNAAGQITGFFSLGHDSIAVALSKWRDTRKLVLGRGHFAAAFVTALMRALGAIAFLVAGISTLVMIALHESMDFSSDTLGIVGLVWLLPLVLSVLLFVGAKRSGNKIASLLLGSSSLARRSQSF